MKKILLVISSGHRLFKYTRKLFKYYAEKHHYELVHINSPQRVRGFPEGNNEHKKLTLIAKYLARCDRLVYAEPYCLINPNCPDLTEIIPPSRLGALVTKRGDSSLTVNTDVLVFSSSKHRKLFSELKKRKALSRVTISSFINHRAGGKNGIHLRDLTSQYNYPSTGREGKKLKREVLSCQIFCTHKSDIAKKAQQIYHSSIVNGYTIPIPNGVQLAKPVIADIFNEATKIKKCKMLVFGLGRDSIMWHKLTDSYFIENYQKWIDLNRDIPKDRIVKFTYPEVNVGNCLQKFSAGELDFNQLQVPEEIKKQAPFDIILVDGPQGFNGKCAGRLYPIKWAVRELSKPDTLVYVDDSKRQLEKRSIERFVKSPTRVVKVFTQRNNCTKIRC